MGQPNLDQSLARLQRAEEHLSNLRTVVASVKQAQENAIICEFDPNPPHKLKVRGPKYVPNIPPIVGILIGEVCHNLRSAMDYLVFNLAWLDSGRPQDMTQFPIEDSQKKFAKRKTMGWLKGINDTHIGELETLQPFRGCEWTKILQDLSNRDKHREFSRIYADMQAKGVFVDDPRFWELISPVRAAVHPVQGVVNVKLDFAIKIEFPDRMPVVETLEIVKAGAADALDEFKPDFQQR
jgi:hypothetical protein